MTSRALKYLKIPGDAKRWFELQIIRNLLVGGFLATTVMGLVTGNLLVLILAVIAIPSEIITSRKISDQLNQMSKRSREKLTSRAIALRFESGGSEEIESLAESIEEIPRLEDYLSKGLSSRISILILTPILILTISGGFFLFTEGIQLVPFLLSLAIVFLIQSLRWFLPAKELLSLEKFFPSAHETSSLGERGELEVGPEEGRPSRIGRIKEVRWTDCQLQDGDSDSAFRWGLAPAGRITGVISRSAELRKKFIEAIIDPWSLEIGRVFIDTNRETYRVDHLQRHQWQNEISLISSTPRFASLTVEANLKSIKPRATRERLSALMKEVGLESDLLPNGLSTKVESDNSLFSPSLRRRVALARTLLKDSAVVILDLSSHGSDEATEELLIQRLRDMATAGKVVILISENSLDSSLAKKQIDLDALAPTLIPQVSV
jgi:ABC-type transport system involved in cytochrome bd biosynthesis fused ATPase/permease subunit